MTASSWLQIVLVLAIGLGVSVPIGRYLARVFTDQRTLLDPVLDPVDDLLYRLIGREASRRPMDWKVYTTHVLTTNLLMTLLVFFVLVFQDHLPLNPMRLPGMEPMLAFNTAVSFVTNTNWQNYGGETTLSIFSQMAAIVFPMFTSAATGFVVAMAFIRAFTVKDGGRDLGNFYRDLIRILTRVLLPAAFPIALYLLWQGAPQTLRASVTAHTLGGKDQTITLGPLAAFETIKHLGTNGGGFFAANSAHPFENPTPITNLVEAALMMSLPAAVVVAWGSMIRNRRQGWVLFGVMGVLAVLFLIAAVAFEQAGTPLLAHAGIDTGAGAGQPGGNMEGKEVRFGVAGSGMFAAITTAFTTGSVNSMHDSYTPLGGMVPLAQMMLQCIYGGKGVGFLNALVYGIIAVFVAGLMVGRTPEFLGKKIEKQEVILVSLTLLIHPLLILAPTGWSVVSPYALTTLGNGGIHGYTEILYAFTSCAANNGSAFAGLDGNTPYYDMALGVVILLGRYPAIIFLMGVAGSVARKPTVPYSAGTLRTDTAMFGVFWLLVILVVGALTFFPAIVLGPIAEHFAMRSLHLSP
jgi:K+-transporting ATPase ATPase A chain